MVNLKNYCSRLYRKLFVRKSFLLFVLFNSLLKGLTRLIIDIYKVFLSNYFGNGCRFFPTCSEYGKIAFKSYAFPMALWLTLKRILKCRPGGPCGYDPVPERQPYE